jgi:hypothetical protein
MVMSKERVLSRWRYVGVLIGTAGLIVACGGSTDGASGGGSTDGGSSGGSTDGGSSGGGGAASADAFITEFCKLFEPCCAAASKPNTEPCRNVWADEREHGHYNPSKGEQCLNEFRAQAKEARFCDGDGVPTPQSCNEVFTPNGTKKPGEPCEDEWECAASAEGVVGCVSNRCMVVVKGKEGDDCIGTMDQAGRLFGSNNGDWPRPERATACYGPDGVYCDARTNQCTKSQDVGASCVESPPYACVPTAYCDATTEQCAAKKDAGQECEYHFECAEKHYCDTETKKCTPQIPIGQPCTKTEQCKFGCDKGKCAGGFALLLCGE